MASRYNFEFTGTTEAGDILWLLNDRTGMVWTGTLKFEVTGAENDPKVNAQIHVDDDIKSSIPKHGISLIQHHANKLLRNALKNEFKRLHDLYKAGKLTKENILDV